MTTAATDPDPAHQAMTEDEFIQALRETKDTHKWKLSAIGMIRGVLPDPDGVWDCCPLTAVCKLKLGVLFTSSRPRGAGDRLGIARGLTDGVIYSADHTPSLERWAKLRTRMLDALGL